MPVHRSPDSAAIGYAVTGLALILGGIHRLRQRMKERRQKPEFFGMVSSVRVAGDECVATVSYTLSSGEEHRVEWKPQTEPSLGQTVMLRVDPRNPKRLVVAEAGDSLVCVIAVLVLGVALCGLSGFIWSNIDGLTRR